MKWWHRKQKEADLERELRSDFELEEEEQQEGGNRSRTEERLGREKYESEPDFRDNPHILVQKNDKSITIRGGDFFILSLKVRSTFERETIERQLQEDRFAATLFRSMDNLRVRFDGEGIRAVAWDRRHFRCGLRPLETGDCQR
jgi:hypothetical protein